MHDMNKLSAIIGRAVDLEERFGCSTDRVSLEMDIESVPDLDLDKLMGFDDADFCHDVFGIRRHMDRSSFPGKLRDGFEPRCGRAAKKTD